MLSSADAFECVEVEEREGTVGLPNAQKYVVPLSHFIAANDASLGWQSEFLFLFQQIPSFRHIPLQLRHQFKVLF